MAARTAAAPAKGLLEQIEELRQEVGTIEDAARQHQKQYLDALERRRDLLVQLGKLASEGATSELPSNGVAHHPPVPAPEDGRTARKGKGGRPKKVVAEDHKQSAGAAKTTAKGKGGRPKGGGRKQDKVAPNQRNYSNKISLREAVWQVLDRKPAKHRQSLEDYPKDATGLKIAEIKDIIEQEGIWKSSSKNFAAQIQNHLFDLKSHGKLARNEDDRRWFIVNGATLDGPKLDERGKPIKE